MATGRLKKSSHDRVIAGVCGGIAEHFDMDPTLVRAGYVLLSVLSTGFPGLLVYIVLAFVMPDA
ncbi:MAG: PspC domain-containing protein [Rhodothermales bacterium]|nr:PspC domain-containing protein [Rhodothermales bacterium]